MVVSVGVGEGDVVGDSVGVGDVVVVSVGDGDVVVSVGGGGVVVVLGLGDVVVGLSEVVVVGVDVVVGSVVWSGVGLGGLLVVVPEACAGVPRIATIWSWTEVSFTLTSSSEYDVIVRPNSIRSCHTACRASCFCSPGASSTDRTSWLANAAVMHR